MAVAKPTKPQNAFLLFVEAQHKYYVDAVGPEIWSNKSIIWCSEKWKELTAAAKAPYKLKASQLKAAYDKDVEAYKAAGGEIAHKKRKSKLGRRREPKKSRNAFFLFVQDKRAAIVSMLGAHARSNEVASLCARQWRLSLIHI